MGLYFFTRYNFTVTSRPGSKNGTADALSRRYDPVDSSGEPEPILSPSVIITPIRWDLMEEIQQAQQEDPSPPECPPHKQHISQHLRQRTMEWIHTSLSSSHPCIHRTTRLTRNSFWWPTLNADVTDLVKSCRICGQSKSPRQLPAGLLEPLPIPQCPWSHLAIDFITDLPSSNGFTTILVTIDRFSKSCQLILLKGLPTATEVAETLFYQVFKNYGLPEDIVSYQCQSHIRIPSLIQWAGRRDRNQEIERYLCSYCSQEQHKWSEFLPWTEYA